MDPYEGTATFNLSTTDAGSGATYVWHCTAYLSTMEQKSS
jgi:hypothetical protein